MIMASVMVRHNDDGFSDDSVYNNGFSDGSVYNNAASGDTVR